MSDAPAVIYMLHGVEFTGHQFDPLIECARNSGFSLRNVRFVFPLAPLAPEMPHNPPNRWYDKLYVVEKSGEVITMASTELLVARVGLIQNDLKQLVASGVDPSRIILGGFGPGACLTFAALLLLKDVKVGGVVAYCGYLPSIVTFAQWVEENGGPTALCNRNVPVMHIQGSEDPHIPPEVYNNTREYFVLELGFTNWRYRLYPSAGHKLTPEMYAELWRFIQQVLES